MSIFICPTHRPCIIPLIIATIAIHRNAYKAPKPKPSPKKKKVDDAAAAVKRKKRIDMLSESPSRETRWPIIERSDLNADQDAAADIILNGANVFLTGWLVSCLIEDYSNHLTNLYPNQLPTHPSYSPYLPYPTYLPIYLPTYLTTSLPTYLPTYVPTVAPHQMLSIYSVYRLSGYGQVLPATVSHPGVHQETWRGASGR